MADAPRPSFLDTNHLVCSLLNGASSKQSFALALLVRGGTISVQVLNEFANVGLRKLRLSHAEVADGIAQILTLLPDPLALRRATHASAVALVQRYSLSFYDALLVASALEAGCTTLLSEDMQDGLVVSRALTIRNPFRPAALS